MPEGDTIHRTAARLRRALQGRRLTRLEAPRLPRPMPPPGTRVDAVTARGKHLLVDFDDGLVLHTHLRMHGAWHVLVGGPPSRRGRGRVRALLADDTVRAVCLDAPVVELLDQAAVARHPVLRRLGPDLCLPDVDLDEAVARMAHVPEPDRALVEVLLDQRVAAGIGNVFASELAFLAGRHPRTPLHDLDLQARRALLAEGARLLQHNLHTPRRTTVPDAPDGSLWVYDRAGRACRRCGTPIEVARLGDGARPTYWCPRCQPAAR